MSGPQTGPTSKGGLQTLAIPAVCILFAFLGLFSQWLFHSPDLAPGPPSRHETYLFNALFFTAIFTYYRACTVDPGRYTFPATPTSPSSKPPPGTRWCKKCRAPKPPRAHHCRHCARCIPKMDHHCPWTANCVSMTTFPHFVRFLLYTNLSLFLLLRQTYLRLSSLYSSRHLPSYLGPSLPALTSLAILSLVASGTAFALLVLLVTTLRSCLLNRTMIEEWQLERHESVLSRLDPAAEPGDYWGADGDARVLARALARVEFPYDVGFLANVAQAMGTSNPLAWLFPLAGAPVVAADPPGRGPGWDWEENGFNDLPGLWPPPDPEKLRRAGAGWPAAAAAAAAEGEDELAYYRGVHQTAEETKAAFRRRQEADFQRRGGLLAELEETGEDNMFAATDDGEWEGEPMWTNSEGDRLWDYGVDEEVERHDEPVGDEGEDEDDVPIAELIRRRRAHARQEDDG
ncbi:Palmitoyltransferase PFA4 [Podospora conica]|nr:Palmitoyltransferase PFA4 [Schizothecium conicum]